MRESVPREMIGIMMIDRPVLTFDLDVAARAAYEAHLAFRSWDELDQTERDDWRGVALAAIEAHDPVVFGTVMIEMRRLWRVISPVVGPFVRLLIREDSCTKPE